jgi:hypothetical protein
MVIFNSYVNVYQRVTPLALIHLDNVQNEGAHLNKVQVMVHGDLRGTCEAS